MGRQPGHDGPAPASPGADPSAPTLIPTHCPSHRYAVSTMAEARSMVALMRDTLSAETCAAVAALIAGQSGGDCPAAAVARQLSAAAWREIGGLD